MFIVEALTRAQTGILQFADKNSNILITNATERVFPDFELPDSVDELSPVSCVPSQPLILCDERGAPLPD